MEFCVINIYIVSLCDQHFSMLFLKGVTDRCFVFVLLWFVYQNILVSFQHCVSPQKRHETQEI